MRFQRGIYILNKMMDKGFSKSIITTVVNMRNVAVDVDEMDFRLLNVLEQEESTQRDLQNLINEMAHDGSLI